MQSLMVSVFLCGLATYHCSFLNETDNRNSGAMRRHRRYLVFEKGSTFTIQGNIAKGILSGAPRGLNEIAEYTLIYDLPTDLHSHKRKLNHQTMAASGAKIPNNIRGQHWRRTSCDRRHFYDLHGKETTMCLKRIKRVWQPNGFSAAQRIFYDLIDKWSRMEGYLPRYCFMRTLCEAPQMLLPPGHSLLHDIIHILLRYTTPWVVRHETFGRSLTQRHRIDECATLYGPHCRVSWLRYITNAVHGPLADFVD